MPSVFLSHSSKDKFFARKLAETLGNNGVDVWIDEAELRIGDSLIGKISAAIEKADYVAAILSPRSIRSNWVQTELRLAMTQEIEGRRIKVLPILMEPCEIPAFLQDKIYADFSDPGEYDGPLERLLHALGVERPTAAAQVEPEADEEVPRSQPPDRPALEGFDDLRIVDIDKGRAYRPDPEKHLFHVYLELSAHPTQEWVQIFDAERQFPRHTMWRHAWIEGQYIVVHCVPEEVKKYHLRDLKQDVEHSNDKYRQFLQRVAAQRARKEAEEQKLLEGLDDALDDLDLS